MDKDCHGVVRICRRCALIDLEMRGWQAFCNLAGHFAHFWIDHIAAEVTLGVSLARRRLSFSTLEEEDEQKNGNEAGIQQNGDHNRRFERRKSRQGFLRFGVCVDAIP